MQFSNSPQHHRTESDVAGAEAKTDILNQILKDHDDLKSSLRLLKSMTASIPEKQKLFDDFARKLTLHAKAESESLYAFMENQSDLRALALEGDIEHGLADQLIRELKKTQDTGAWAAKVKVLAELVEHHLTEEEEDVIPLLKRKLSDDDRIRIGQTYYDWKAAITQRLEDKTLRTIVHH